MIKVLNEHVFCFVGGVFAVLKIESRALNIPPLLASSVLYNKAAITHQDV